MKVCLHIPLCCCGDILWLLPRSRGHVVCSDRCRSSVHSGVSMSDLQGSERPAPSWPSWCFSHGASKRLPRVNTNKGSHLLPCGWAVECIIWLQIQILNTPKLSQETKVEKMVTMCRKDKLPAGRWGKQIQSVEETTGVKVTLTPNTA